MHLLLGEINVKAEYKIKLARSLSTVGTGWVTAGTLKYVFEWQLIKKKTVTRGLQKKVNYNWRGSRNPNKRKNSIKRTVPQVKKDEA